MVLWNRRKPNKSNAWVKKSNTELPAGIFQSSFFHFDRSYSILHYFKVWQCLFWVVVETNQEHRLFSGTFDSARFLKSIWIGLVFEVHSVSRVISKVECVFPMAIVSLLPQAEFGRNDHQEKRNLLKIIFPVMRFSYCHVLLRQPATLKNPLSNSIL